MHEAVPSSPIYTRFQLLFHDTDTDTTQPNLV